MVERILGKAEVGSSILPCGTISLFLTGNPCQPFERQRKLQSSIRTDLVVPERFCKGQPKHGPAHNGVAFFVETPAVCRESEGEFNTLLQPSLQRQRFRRPPGKRDLPALQLIDACVVRSVADFTQDITGETTEASSNLQHRIDWERMARDPDINDVLAIETAFDEVHIIWRS